MATDTGHAILEDLIQETDYRSWLLQSARDKAGKQRKAQLVSDFLDWMHSLSDACQGQLTEMATQIA